MVILSVVLEHVLMIAFKWETVFRHLLLKLGGHNYFVCVCPRAHARGCMYARVCVCMSTKTIEAKETVLIEPFSDCSHAVVYSHPFIAQLYVYSQLMTVLIEIL